MPEFFADAPSMSGNSGRARRGGLKIGSQNRTPPLPESDKTDPGKPAHPHVRALTCGFWVEVLRRYSNRPDLLGPMLDVLRRLQEGDHTEEPGGVQSREGGTLRPNDRLSGNDVSEIVDQFRAGVPKHRLATQYGMSLSTLKRLLRKHR